MTERFTFDLIDEPWIPCIRADGTVVELGIRQTLTDAPTLREISDPSPLVTATLHRLLLAILHRTHGSATTSDWAAVWESGVFDTASIDTYLDEQRDRFDLFHPEHPFYQTAKVETEYAKPVAYMGHELLLGTPPTLFHQTPVDLSVSPGRAARLTLALHGFALRGTGAFRSSHGETEKIHKSARDGSLTTKAMLLIRGSSLFETLCLNLVAYDGDDGQPWSFDPAEDLPAWERDSPTDAEDRHPDGYLDLLTWQSRRIRLIPETDGDRIFVARAVVMKGFGLSSTWKVTNDPMVAFWKRPTAKPSESPWIPLTFDPARALWRNSLSLYQSTEAQTLRPKTADWIANLATDEILPQGTRYAIDALGLAIHPIRAVTMLWRHERLPLPLDLLRDTEYAPLIAQALDAAEDAANQLRPGYDKSRKQQRALQFFVDSLLGIASQTPIQRDRRPTTKGAEFLKSLGIDERYWSRLEAPFRDFIVALPADREGALEAWINRVEETARVAFEETMRSFDTSARALKAEALASRRFRRALADALAPYRDTVRQLAADAAS